MPIRLAVELQSLRSACATGAVAAASRKAANLDAVRAPGTGCRRSFVSRRTGWLRCGYAQGGTIELRWCQSGGASVERRILRSDDAALLSTKTAALRYNPTPFLRVGKRAGTRL